MNPASDEAVGVAYSNNIPGATATTEYAYGYLLDAWFIVNPPNAGTLVFVSSATGVSSGPQPEEGRRRHRAERSRVCHLRRQRRR